MPEIHTFAFVACVLHCTTCRDTGVRYLRPACPATHRSVLEVCVQGKATRIDLFNLRTPQMRAFHLSWMAFFVCFFGWFDPKIIARVSAPSPSWKAFVFRLDRCAR